MSESPRLALVEATAPYAEAAPARRRREVLARLSGAVERLLAAGESYTNLSVARLVKEAGLARSTFYVYFDDKADLLSALTEEAVHELVETTRFWWDLPPDADRADLREALRKTYEAFLPHKGVMASVVEVASYDPEVSKRYDALVARSIDQAAAHIEEGIRDGFVAPDLDPRRTAAWICWMIERGLNYIGRPGHGRELEDWLTGLTGLVWNTLYRKVHG
jgi:TetR/AcrR family transcriptional regulator, ethionamide resistance regulator